MSKDEQQSLMITEQDAQLAISTPFDLLRMATERGMSVEVLERFEKMWERSEERRKKEEFAADFARMKPRLPKVIRTKRNEQTNSMYAPLEDVNATIDPILQEFGFSTGMKVVASNAEGVTVRVELWHKNGHIESTEIWMPLDTAGIKGTVNKTGPHAVASSITYAKRVGLCALLNISTGDDTDGNSPDASVFQGDEDGAGSLTEALEWISNCRNVKELTDVYLPLYEKAQNGRDKEAMKRLLSAKLKRQRELGQ